MIPCLTAVATGDLEITLTRDFNAAPALLWRALTDPQIVPRWLWSHVAPMTACDMDLRPGGHFRWVWTRQDGNPMGVSGRFLTVDAPHLLVHTEVFDEDWTDGESTVTQTLTEIAPHITRLTMVVRYATTKGRDAALGSAMAEGMEEAYAKLDTMFTAL